MDNPAEPDAAFEPDVDLDELGTTQLHAVMVEAVRTLPEDHPVTQVWQRLDDILTAGGIECLPDAWDNLPFCQHATQEEADRCCLALPDPAAH
ncbi:hypothetical protein AB0K51_18770 [Kitasatospora sp. NPDC049285]|uniref:hypothetical protein n=1 Tax=Kitasatospora sp. NPDC049285 TaxID=3157096 RepID=UPI00342897CD